MLSHDFPDVFHRRLQTIINNSLDIQNSEKPDLLADIAEKIDRFKADPEYCNGNWGFESLYVQVKPLFRCDIEEIDRYYK